MHHCDWLFKSFPLHVYAGTDDEAYRKKTDQHLFTALATCLQELFNVGVLNRIYFVELAYRRNMTNYNRIAATLNRNITSWAANKTWVNINHLSVSSNIFYFKTHFHIFPSRTFINSLLGSLLVSFSFLHRPLH